MCAIVIQMNSSPLHSGNVRHRACVRTFFLGSVLLGQIVSGLFANEPSVAPHRAIPQSVTVTGTMLPCGISEVEISSGNARVKALTVLDFKVLPGSLELSVQGRPVRVTNFVTVPSERAIGYLRSLGPLTTKGYRISWNESLADTLKTNPFSYALLTENAALEIIAEAFHAHALENWEGLLEQRAWSQEAYALWKVQVDAEAAQRAERRAKGEPPVTVVKIEQEPRSVASQPRGTSR